MPTFGRGKARQRAAAAAAAAQPPPEGGRPAGGEDDALPVAVTVGSLLEHLRRSTLADLEGIVSQDPGDAAAMVPELDRLLDLARADLRTAEAGAPALEQEGNEELVMEIFMLQFDLQDLQERASAWRLSATAAGRRSEDARAGPAPGAAAGPAASAAEPAEPSPAVWAAPAPAEPAAPPPAPEPQVGDPAPPGRRGKKGKKSRSRGASPAPWPDSAAAAASGAAFGPPAASPEAGATGWGAGAAEGALGGTGFEPAPAAWGSFEPAAGAWGGPEPAAGAWGCEPPEPPPARPALAEARQGAAHEPAGPWGTASGSHSAPEPAAAHQLPGVEPRQVGGQGARARAVQQQQRDEARASLQATLEGSERSDPTVLEWALAQARHFGVDEVDPDMVREADEALAAAREAVRSHAQQQQDAAECQQRERARADEEATRAGREAQEARRGAERHAAEEAALHRERLQEAMTELSTAMHSGDPDRMARAIREAREAGIPKEWRRVQNALAHGENLPGSGEEYTLEGAKAHAEAVGAAAFTQDLWRDHSIDAHGVFWFHRQVDARDKAPRETGHPDGHQNLFWCQDGAHRFEKYLAALRYITSQRGAEVGTVLHAWFAVATDMAAARGQLREALEAGAGPEELAAAAREAEELGVDEEDCLLAARVVGARRRARERAARALASGRVEDLRGAAELLEAAGGPREDLRALRGPLEEAEADHAMLQAWDEGVPVAVDRFLEQLSEGARLDSERRRQEREASERAAADALRRREEEEREAEDRRRQAAAAIQALEGDPGAAPARARAPEAAPLQDVHEEAPPAPDPEAEWERRRAAARSRADGARSWLLPRAPPPAAPAARPEEPGGPPAGAAAAHVGPPASAPAAAGGQVAWPGPAQARSAPVLLAPPRTGHEHHMARAGELAKLMPRQRFEQPDFWRVA